MTAPTAQPSDDLAWFWDGFAAIVAAPGGVARARELILSLAVQGKLVPQDVFDEPAAQLLKRITDERNRLVKQGDLRRSAPLAPISADEIPFELPRSWVWTRLGEIANFDLGRTPPTKEARYWDDAGTPWVSIADMTQYGTVVETAKRVSDLAVETIFPPIVPAGTLLMSFKLTIGKVSILGVDAFHNEAIISIFPEEGVSQGYLFRFLPLFAAGTTSKNALKGNTLNKGSLNDLLVSIPPIAEQQRIVARVDELMQLCDQLEALEADKRAARADALRVSLARLLDAPDAATSRARWGCLSAHWPELLDTPASVAPLRQTILGLAVRGQLVPQDEADEPASHLLKQIAAEKARLIAAKKLKKSPPLPPIDANETPFELPESWKWAHIGDVSIIQGGKRLPAGSDFSPVDTPYIYIQVTNMKEGSIVESSLKYIDEDTHKILARYIIEEDDLYITIAGTIGQPGIVPSRFHRMHLTENAAKIVFQGFHKSYFLLALQSSSTQDQFAEKTNQMAQPKLALKRIADALIPLPPLAEQERIVARVDELMALCDRLETELRAAQNASEALGVAAVRRLASG